nr:MAG TPA: hypothetical protein [Bacteriophage sp.]
MVIYISVLFSIDFESIDILKDVEVHHEKRRFTTKD